MAVQTELEIETLIDGEPFAWHAAGEFAWGSGPPLCRLDSDPLLPGLGPDGCRNVDLPPGCADQLVRCAARLLGFDRVEMLESYHQRTDDAQHLRTIDIMRELQLVDLDVSGQSLIQFFSNAVGVDLGADLTSLVILRINRPGSTDYNPPHRDGSLPIWANTLNIWIPIAGVDSSTALPLVPGSHRIAERECWQTRPGGVAIGGRRYRVPAIARLRNGPLAMVRSPVAFGQALLFTPFLIHGLAANRSVRTRMALELRLNARGS